MSIKIRELRISGAQLREFPEPERVFFVHAAHLSNSVMILQKWLLFCRIEDSSPAERGASVAQQMLVARMLSGVLHEGWQLLQKSYFGSQLSRSLEPKIGADGAKALSDLKAYFSTTNLIEFVRNKFAFHFDRSEVVNVLGFVQDDDSYQMFLSETRGNTLHYMSEEIVGHAMLRGMQAQVTPRAASLGEAEALKEMHSRLYADLIRTSRAFEDFISECILALALARLPESARHVAAEYSLADDVPMSAIRIPFFVSKP